MLTFVLAISLVLHPASAIFSDLFSEPGVGQQLLGAFRSQTPCVTSCWEESCDQPTIRYGKFCGVRQTGCPGEQPCDSVDVCCLEHDNCVARTSIFNTNCHLQFIECLRSQSGRIGFSQKCPYDVVIPTMEKWISTAVNLLG